MTGLPASYASEREALGFGEISYGIGGIELYETRQLESAQIGYSVASNGRALAGDGDGHWHRQWIVIGHETACGDPIFLSADPPYPVFTAIHGQGEWAPALVAPSLDSFWRCLALYRQFASDRGIPGKVEPHPPTPDEIQHFLGQILNICEDNGEAMSSWAIWADIDLSQCNSDHQRR